LKLIRLSPRASEKVQKHSDIINELWVKSVVTFMPQEKRVYISEDEYELTAYRRKKQVTLSVHEYDYDIVVYGIHVTKIG